MTAETNVVLPESVEPVPCSLCGSWDARQLYPAAERRNGHGEPNDLYACTSTAFGVCGPIVKCLHCSLVYQSPVPPHGEIIDSYAGVVDERYEQERSGRIETFGRDLAALQRHQRSGRLLDVGCHIGLVLEVDRDAGWEGAGVEPSLWAVKRARAHGLDVRHGTLQEGDFDEESRDVVTMWDVVEHLADPLAELRRVHRLLRPNGLLALSTMNVDALFPRLMGRRWPWYMQMHLVYFSRRTLQSTLAKAGFRVVEMVPHKRVVRLAYLVSRLEPYSHLAYRSFDWLVRLSRQSDRLVGVDLGDIFVTFARKTSSQ